MIAVPQRICPSCGNEFSGAMEFCPVCMLRKGLAGEVESGESSASEGTVKPTTPEQSPLRFEHYELVTGEDGKPVELGRGAMGVTYKAFDVDLRCPVTLKVISERYQKSSTSGWLSRSMSQMLKPRFQHLVPLPEPQSLPALSSSQECPLTSARTCTLSA